MNKLNFLNQLRQGLSGLSESEINEIVRDQDEYISDGINSGRSEDEIIRSLGAPKEMARQLLVGANLKTATNEDKMFPKLKGLAKVVLGICMLAPLNLVVLLIPLSVVGTLIASFWISAIALGFGSGIFSVARILFLELNFREVAWTLLMSMGGIGLSILSLMGCYFLTWALLKKVFQFLEWNYKFLEDSYEKSI
jgi:uncharacterized membrane protein